MAGIEPLPPALSSCGDCASWDIARATLDARRVRAVAARRVADALLALWLMLLGKGVLEHRPGMVEGAAIGLGISTAATWFLRTIGTRVQRRFRDKVTIALEFARRANCKHR